ncbi:MAG: hypothetical protein WA954_10665 [Parerythrobacter sp.]
MMITRRPIHVHPEKVVAYAYVRHPPSADGRQPIYAAGALSVTLKFGTEVEFERHHSVYERNAGGNPFADLFGLLDPTAHLISVQQPGSKTSENHRRDDHWLRYQMASLSMMRAQRQGHQLLTIKERVLRAFAEDYSIPIATPNASIETQARLVADRAQIVWLAWAACALGSDPDQHAIIAAFRAWRILDEQRPIPF